MNQLFINIFIFYSSLFQVAASVTAEKSRLLTQLAALESTQAVNKELRDENEQLKNSVLELQREVRFWIIFAIVFSYIYFCYFLGGRQRGTSSGDHCSIGRDS